jgi:hypothetical protein
MSIVPFLNNQVFDAELTQAMGKAFDAAWIKLDGGRRPSELVKEVLAKRIIDLALTGERDPQQLCAKALPRAASSIGITHSTDLLKTGGLAGWGSPPTRVPHRTGNHHASQDGASLNKRAKFSRSPKLTSDTAQ